MLLSVELGTKFNQTLMQLNSRNYEVDLSSVGPNYYFLLPRTDPNNMEVYIPGIIVEHQLFAKHWQKFKDKLHTSRYY